MSSYFSRLKSFLELKNTLQDSQNLTVLKDNRYFCLNIASVLEEAVKFDGFIITATDITYEKELENKEMEHEKMLISNAKMAVVGEMIGSISHQQRQPLSSILLSLGNIEECVDNEDFSDIRIHIHRCKNGIRLMDETINAFRSFYKNDSNITVFNAKNVINELIFIIKPQMNTSGILFEFICDGDEFKVAGSPSYLKQILLSLLANSKDELVKFVESLPADANFEPRISINLYKADKEVCISVTDNGRGIEANSDDIFKPFFTTKKDVGTGMGLYVARVLATDKLSGRLILESPKNPTKFSLFLKVDTD